LSHIRICDLTGQLAGAGSTRTLGPLAAEIIRVEDPVREGRWDITRGTPPFVDGRRGNELGGSFNQFNVEKLGVTINLRDERGRELFAKLVEKSDVVTENFAAGVLARLGFSYEDLRAIRPDIIYVSNCGFGHTGPYAGFRTWGPIVQACCGLSFLSGVPGQPPAGLGFSYMDHQGGNIMAIAILAALIHRNRTGEGQWVDMSCVEAGITLDGPALLDFTVNGRPTRRDDYPDSNHSDSPLMAPHNVYPAAGEDRWVAVACRNDEEWSALADVIDQDWARDARLSSLAGRVSHQSELDGQMSQWTSTQDRYAVAQHLQAVGVPAAAVQTAEERIENDPGTGDWGLFPMAHHPVIGDVRVDGLPIHLSGGDWTIEQGAPCLGEDNARVFGGLLGLTEEELTGLRADGVI
jgi:crotonobetainyl-CoA:carnitine CoA-transferase CaiB-like acyl-CoA transferase